MKLDFRKLENRIYCYFSNGERKTIVVRKDRKANGWTVGVQGSSELTLKTDKLSVMNEVYRLMRVNNAI